MRGRSRVRIFASLICFVTLAACATSEPPVAQMSAARSMVNQAQSLASRYAPAELKGAEAKLARAETAYHDNDWIMARRLAEEAEADASYALSVAENERTQRASAELAQSIDQLKRELDARPQ